jgi:uncharacterized protein (TIGR03085 family)
MPRHALDERIELAETLRAAQPDAPTLCGTWTVRLLAAHLVLRERSAKELLGRAPSKRLRAVAEGELHAFAERTPWDQLVREVESGPSWSGGGVPNPIAAFWAVPPVRENFNLLEYVVHHEDVRRAEQGWVPRVLPVNRQQALWSKVRIAARLTLRAAPVPVRLVWPAHGEVTVGRGEHRVTATGDPVELTLLAFGRQRVARVDYDGAADDVARLTTARIAV